MNIIIFMKKYVKEGIHINARSKSVFKNVSQNKV